MAGPTVEELLRAGGRRRKPQAEPQVGEAETFVNRAVGMIPGANRLTDAIAAMALEAGSSGGVRATLTPEARADLQAMGEDVPEDPGLVDRYREVRDRRAERTEAGSQQNPWAGRAGALTGFGLSLFAPLPKSSGAGLGAAVKTGAGYGAFHGLTEGGADLTRGEFAEGAADTLKGAAMGAGLGAGLHGAMRLGQRAAQGLRNARQDVLSQETAAAQEAAEEAQAAAAKVADGERKVVGQAREMNKAFDRKGALREQRGQAQAQRSEERARRVLERARQREAPPEEPNTKMLQDMRAKAEERRAVNYDRVRQRQKDLEDPAITPEGKVENQQYIDRYGHAVNDPGAFRREFVERYLRQKYGPEMAERLMRERIGPRGEVLPRAAPAPNPAAAADDVSAGAQPRLGPGEEQLPAAPDTAPPAGRLPSPLAPPPAIREGAQGMPYGRNLRPEPLPPEPTTQMATQSMATPRDVPLESMPTRAASVPNIQRPPTPTPAAAPPAEVPTVPGRAAPQPPAPPPSPAGGTSEEVTRLGGPEDVGVLAAERAAQRERWLGQQGVLPAVGRAVSAGVSGGHSTLGSIWGAAAGLTREMLRDPAVKARVLSAARLHVLARINPALYARVGAQLQAGGQNQRAAEHLLARKDPEYREARQKAAEQVAAMSDQQLVDLFAQANSPN